MKAPWHRVLCPFCFAKFQMKEAWFRCRSPKCATEVDMPLSRHRGVPNTRANKALDPTTVKRRGHEAECDVDTCRQPTSVRICPHCHSTLPPQFDNVDSRILAVVGGRNAGKSHYIATLVDQLRKVWCPRMNIQFRPVFDTTTLNYRQNYYEPVYQKKQVLPQTQQAAANPVIREPLIYRMEFPRTLLGAPALNLVLFDAAGEDLQNADLMAIYNRYILHASGIISLINPLGLQSICERLGVEPDEGEMPLETQDRMITSLNPKPGKPIKIPTAFVLAKADELRPIVNDSASFLDPGPIGQVPSADELMANDEDIRAHLADWGEEALLNSGRKFKTHGYFAASALGHAPDMSALTIPGAISPSRVCDPVFWLLSQLGYAKLD